MRLLLTIPARQRERMARSVLELHATAAIQGAEATWGYLAGEQSPASLEEARETLAGFGDLLDQLAWPAPPQPVMTEVSAERALLSEAVGAALDSALEDVRESYERYRRGGCDVDEIATQLGGADELVRLFAETELVERE